ncbi:MAG: CoA-binding protein [Flavobacteriales bacterium]|nr:CoA-binding protein [Flavobacteriales bacterium]MCB9166432.1 CoA-binding protein [Flavobacteriales bacterium]
METRTTLVLGASLRADRYSNLAVRRLKEHGKVVIAVGLREGTIDDVPVVREIPMGTPIDTVTLYLNAANQMPLEEYILALHPRRIIFNPGAENDHLAMHAKASGIAVVEGCTLVMLSAGTY